MRLKSTPIINGWPFYPLSSVVGWGSQWAIILELKHAQGCSLAGGCLMTDSKGLSCCARVLWNCCSVRHWYDLLLSLRVLCLDGSCSFLYINTTMRWRLVLTVLGHEHNYSRNICGFQVKEKERYFLFSFSGFYNRNDFYLQHINENSEYISKNWRERKRYLMACPKSMWLWSHWTAICFRSVKDWLCLERYGAL